MHLASYLHLLYMDSLTSILARSISDNEWQAKTWMGKGEDSGGEGRGTLHEINTEPTSLLHPPAGKTNIFDCPSFLFFSSSPFVCVWSPTKISQSSQRVLPSRRPSHAVPSHRVAVRLLALRCVTRTSRLVCWCTVCIACRHFYQSHMETTNRPGREVAETPRMHHMMPTAHPTHRRLRPPPSWRLVDGLSFSTSNSTVLHHSLSSDAAIEHLPRHGLHTAL
ncbi:hypothetical protein LZ32DRAFT_281668 [Colletotrichum eremochloae]|nr:hypothetical protein LZ32DRAFT_281668 [Colletotrichum eremochloae]